MSSSTPRTRFPDQIPLTPWARIETMICGRGRLATAAGRHVDKDCYSETGIDDLRDSVGNRVEAEERWR